MSGKERGGRHNAHDFATYCRRAHFAGSWYADDADALEASLHGYLQQAATESQSTAAVTSSLRAVICPHAGYAYSGPTAAFSYGPLEQELRRRGPTPTTIVVLHPSHHVYLTTCAVSGATVLETPLGNLTVDTELRQEILQLGDFGVMSQADDEAEHSGEMQYPYLAKIGGTAAHIKVLPIMCGALSNEKEASYGRLMANILQRPGVLTVVSTDFCHWGKRFGYQPHDLQKKIPIHEYISSMDHRGMELIADDWHRPGAFADYLRETRNTICGRHAVAVWLRALACAYPQGGPTVAFVKYAQSSAAVSLRDSSVSYAAAVCSLESNAA
jgi:hypothetical protein